MNRHGSLNHIFGLVWSRATNRWIPVAETMRVRSKGSGRLLIAAALSLSTGTLEAGPLGGQVVTGAGTIAQTGTTTTVTQASQNLLLDWKSFNIAPQETVNFVQPSVTSIAVNRIFDINGTQILGHLNANGQVYLINPNGILFGRGAQVDVGGLVASTLDFSGPTFGADTKTFSGSGSGSIVNNGTINASSEGYVALLANTVINRGAISAQLGSVALGAASAATLTFAGNHLVHMQVDRGVLNTLAENSGVIRADGGQVFMTAGAQDTLLASVVNNTGVIEANTVENRGGSIALLGGAKAGSVIVKGTLDVSSATTEGGEIVVTGGSVTVGDGARVEATGSTGGGSIAIGGEWQGSGAIPEATTVYVSNTATLDASATGRGNGGGVVVRSNVNDANSATRVYGTLLARGGADGGNGGRIETSGHYLDVSDIVVDASGSGGHAGEWLLDPYNVIIGSTTSGNAYTPPGFSPTSSDSTILASAISTALTGGSNVTITTGSSGSSLGDITVSTAITKTAGATTTLTLQAADSIIIQQPITNTSTAGMLNVNLWADNDSGTHDGVGVVILNNSITTKGGAIAFGTNALQTINGVSTLVGGDVYVGGASAVALSTGGGAIGFYGQLIVANAGGFNLNSANGNVTFAGLVDSGDTYAYVGSAAISWTAALSAAKSGLGANTGDTYLATITSRLENSVAGASASYRASWLGAERVTGIGTDAVWRWVAGPEGLQNGGQGLKFFTQNGTQTTNGSGGAAIGSAYTNWNSGEPNNSGGSGLSAGASSEYVMQFVGNQGQWNDLSPASTSVLGYITETNLAPSSLNVSAGTGAVTFASAIGSNKPLSTLSVSATTIALPSPATVNTTGAQTFTGQVTVGGTNVNVLTVSADNLVTTYGSGRPALTTSYSGFVNGNTVASLTTPAAESTTAAAQPNAGSYPITPSGVVDPNYYILYNPGNLIVNVATLNITASSPTKTYGAANPALTVTNSGFQYSDTASILTTLATASTAATTTSNAGTYATSAAGAVTSSSNYTIAYIPGTLTVNPAPLTVSGLSGTARNYNGSTVDTLTGTGVLSGLQNGEALTLVNGNTGTLASANAGSEALSTAITLDNGTGLASNYAVTQPTLANVAIGQAALTVSGTVTNNKVYDRTTTATLTGASLIGVFAGDAVTLTQAGSFASRDVGTGITVTAADTLGGAAASNYLLTQPTGLTASITPKELGLTLSGNPTRVYDATTTFDFTGYTSSLSGVISGDAVSAGTGSVTGYGDKNAGANKPVTFTGFALTGPNAGDYQLISGAAASTASITPALISNVVGITANNKVYDGGLNATLNNGSVVFTGEASGDNLTVATDTGTFAGKNVATGSAVSVSAITLGGADALNYTLGNTTARTTANITQLNSVVWIGPATGGSWSNPANWAGGAIPDLSNVANVVVPAGDTVTFDASVAGPVQLSNLSSGGLTIAGGTLDVSNALNLTNYAQSAGTVGGPGSFKVSGAFSQTAGQINMGPGSVSISQSQGNLSFANIAAGAINLSSSAGSVTLGTLAATANLAVTALGGSITQSVGASLAVGGTTALQASDAGVPANIALTDANNTFGSAVNASGAQVNLSDAGPLTLGTVNAAGNLTLASNGVLDLGSSIVGGNLSTTSGNGDVIQNGPLHIDGATDIVAGSGSIHLNNPDNVFIGKVTTQGGNVAVAGDPNEFSVNPLVATVVSQLESSTLMSGAGSDAFTGSALVNVTLSIGANGPALRVINGGVHLPDYTVSVSE